MKKKNRLFLAVLLLIIGLLGTSRAYADENYGTDAYVYMQTLQTNFPERAVAYPNLDAAAAWLKDVITTIGYEHSSQPFSIPAGEGIVINGENIIFSKKGASDQVILVGAHYDSVLTRGTDDNATGVGLLLETAARLSGNQNLPYTVRFVLFSAEEPGCYGSQFYVDNLDAAARSQIVCMINLDTIGAGDVMYLYGGGLAESGHPVRTWAVEQAMQTAQNLGLDMNYHPDVNGSFPVPTKNTDSDHQAFDRAGIPYIYFEASNWNGDPYTNFFQTADPDFPNGKMMHIAEFENIDFYNAKFPGRVAGHLQAYSQLLDYLLNHMTVGYSPLYENRSGEATALADVRIRAAASAEATVLDVLLEGNSIPITGYSEEWCRVNYNGTEGYVKTEFLNVPEAETVEEETTEEIVTETEEPETEELETEKLETEAEIIETEALEAAVTESEKTETKAAETVTETKAEEVSSAAAPTITVENGSQKEFSAQAVINQATEWIQSVTSSSHPLLILAVAIGIILLLLLLILSRL